MNFKFFKSFLAFVFLTTLGRAQDLPGASGNLEFGADEYSSNLDTKETELKGSVKLFFESRSLFADKVFLKSQEGTARAEGHVVFKQGRLTIRGESVDLNMRTGLGTFYEAVVQVDKGISIFGKEISRVGEDRFRVYQGKITTCQSCPYAWSVTGATMDVQVEEYAEVHHALFQVRDAPVAYFPVFIFPVKTKRQSGFLLPQYSYSSQTGSQVQAPYFWAINEKSDATFEYDFLSKGGNRLWSEYRILESDRSYFRGQGSLLRNDSIPNVPDTRYGYSIEQRSQINSRWVQRFRGEGASDRLYTAHFEREFKATGLPTLENEPSLSWQNDDLYHYSLLRFHRDNLPRDQFGVERHYGPINSLPEVSLANASYRLLGPLRATTELRSTSYRRGTSALDPDTGWVRTGNRSTALLKFTAPMNFLDRIDWDPRVELRGDNYYFDAPGTPRSASRARVLSDQRLSSTFYRIYPNEGKELKALKHTLTPQLRWTYSPADGRSSHPFFDQSENPRFDLFDPNAIAPTSGLGTFGEEQRLKPNHILTVGATTRLVGRYGESLRTYEDHLGLTVERDFDYRKNREGRLRVSAFGAVVGFRLSTEVSVNLKTQDSDMRNDASFRHPKFYLGVFQKISPIEETYGIDSSVKFLGPLELSAFEVYNARTARVAEETYGLLYRSPSQCWIFSLGMTRKNGVKDFDYTPVIRLTLSDGARDTTF